MRHGGDCSTHCFLVRGDQRAVVALVVLGHIKVLNVLDDLCHTDRRADG